MLKVGKIVSATYHLNKGEAKRELNVFVGDWRLVFQQAPNYLSLCLDRYNLGSRYQNAWDLHTSLGVLGI